MNQKGNIALIVLIVVLVLGLIGGSIYFYYAREENDLKNVQTIEEKTQEIPVEYKISGVPYYSEKGGFCYGESSKMILEYDGMSKDEVAEFETYVKKNGKGGPPDAFNGFDKFGYKNEIRIGYKKDFNKSAAEFYDNFLADPDEQVEIFSNQDEAFKKLKQLVSSDIPVIAIVDNGNHYVVVYGYDENNIYVNDPDPDNGGENKIIQNERFLEQWNISDQSKSTAGVIGFPGDYGMIWLGSEVQGSDDMDDDLEDGLND